MGFTEIVNSIDGGQLTPKQRAELKAILKTRRKDLQTALANVDTALKKLSSTAKKKKSKKR
jgi:hypothetical protein